MTQLGSWWQEETKPLPEPPNPVVEALKQQQAVLQQQNDALRASLDELRNQLSRPLVRRVERDDEGNITRVIEER